MTGQGVSSRSSHSAAAGPDDVLGEAVHPLADVLLVLVELEGELRLALSLGRGVGLVEQRVGVDVGDGRNQPWSAKSTWNGVASPNRARDFKRRANRTRADPRCPRRCSRRSGG